jgi:hypothetical protein
VANNADDSLPATKAYFEANGWTHTYDYNGSSLDGSLWVSYGYSYGIPYNVLIDRDGHIRMAAYFADGWEDIIQQCVGAPPYD